MPARKTSTRAATATRTPARAPAKSAPAASSKPAAASPAGAPSAAPAKTKHKLVRDSFTIPKNEYAVLIGLKQRAALLASPAKKSELLRAGIAALNALPDKAFLSALAAVPSLKTGRPKQATPRATKLS